MGVPMNFNDVCETIFIITQGFADPMQCGGGMGYVGPYCAR